MAGNPITKLNSGLLVLKDELMADTLATKRVEIGIIKFGDRAETVTEFITARNFVPPQLEASGMTAMGDAVRQAIVKIQHRKEVYRANRIEYYRPWIFLITDGAPNDPGWEEAARLAKQADMERAFAFFAIGVEKADFGVLRMFTNREPLRLNELRFKDMFMWLSNSLKAVSNSRPGQEVPLPSPITPDGWASVA